MTEPATTVWCASYPKSGNTWMRALMAGVTGDGTVRLRDLGATTQGQGQETLFYEFGLSPSRLGDQLASALMKQAAESEAKRKEGLILRKTHNSYSGAHGVDHDLSTPAHVIYVVRDPRAVAVSMAHHMGYDQVKTVELMRVGPTAMLRSSENNQVDRFVTRGCQVEFDWGSWSEHVNSWIDQIELPVSVIRYEDLIADTQSVLETLIAQLQLKTMPEQVVRTVEQASFNSLAVQEMFGGFAEAAAPDRPFFRKGSADAWREELDQSLAEQIILDHENVMQRLGYLEEK